MTLDGRRHGLVLLAAASAAITFSSPGPIDPVLTRAAEFERSGDLPGALAHVLDSLEERSVTDRTQAARWLAASRLQSNLGRYERSKTAAHRALELAGELTDSYLQGEAFMRLGAAHDELAEYDAAHENFHRALEHARRAGDRQAEAQTLSALATSYRFLGDLDRSLRTLEQANALLMELNQVPQVCFNHRTAGNLLEDLGREREAEQEYRHALEAIGEWDGGWARADVLFHLGRWHARQGHDEQAIQRLEQSADFARRSKNLWALARSHVELARFDATMGRGQRALERITVGIEALERIGAQDLAWEARTLRAKWRSESGADLEARSDLEHAIASIESIRSQIGLPRYRSRYAARSRSPYEALLELDARTWQHDERASRTFELAQRLQARVFREQLADWRLRIDAAPHPIRDEERRLRAQIARLRAHVAGFGPAHPRQDVVRSELADAERQHDALMSRLRSADAGYATLVQGVHAQQMWSEPLLDVDILAFYLGVEGSFGWYSTRSGISMIELPPQEQIADSVLLLHSLTVHRNDPAALRLVSRRLFDTLIGRFPVLGSGRPLVIVPDGALHSLPFEALLAPATDLAPPRALVEVRRVSYAPSVYALADLRLVAHQRPRRLELAVIGRSTRTGGPELTGARGEAERIAALVARQGREIRLADRATDEAVRELAQAGAKVLHVAAHAVADLERPELSGLDLAPHGAGTDGFLDLEEVFNLRVASDLVVLSACETARGKRLAGEGVEGLARAFLFAGSRSVVASLWKVDDRATEALMNGFYRQLVTRKQPVAESLRAAKLEWLDRHPQAREDPFVWAAFVAIGDGEVEVQLTPASEWAWLLVIGGLALSAFSLWALWKSR